MEIFDPDINCIMDNFMIWAMLQRVQGRSLTIREMRISPLTLDKAARNRHVNIAEWSTASMVLIESASLIY